MKPELPWTHNPGTYNHESYERSYISDDEVDITLDGWRCIIVRQFVGQRCGRLHSSDESGGWGSCCAIPNHEHPHVWAWHDWSLKSISQAQSSKAISA